jgi:hypothetical protein
VKDVIDTNSHRRWFQTALFNLVLAALAGVVLRLAFVTEIPSLHYRNLLHGHSHMALIGWGYLAIFALFIDSWGDHSSKYRLFRWLFYGSEIAVLGMYLTFPIYGYKSIPIFFSTLHLVLSYFFVYHFIKEVSRNSKTNHLSSKFAKAALYFHAFSTLGIWILPWLISMGLRHSSAYHMAVQFFLHFQFNGWLIFAILALFFKRLEASQTPTPIQWGKYFYNLLTLSTFLTYALAVTWTQPVPLIFWINSIGVSIQFVALFYFIRICLVNTTFMNQYNIMAQLLLWTAGLSFVLKIFIQTVVIIPDIAVVAYTIRNFVIGFIHLFLLGMVTSYILASAHERGWIDFEKGQKKWGVYLFLFGFLSTEFFLFIQGIGLWLSWGFIRHYYLILMALSCFLLVGLMMLFMGKNALHPTKPEQGL